MKLPSVFALFPGFQSLLGSTSLESTQPVLRGGGGGRGSCLENPRDGGAWWAAVYGVAQSRMESSDKTCSTGEGNGKPLQYSCLEKPMNSMKRQNDRILKEELPR